MNVLDSSPEALAFSYLSYGIFDAVNTLWPWIAVLTAAVGFWRIRTAGPSSCSVDALRQPDCSPPRFVPPETSQSQQTPSTSSEVPATAVETRTSAAPDCDNWVTKGRKFTVKFRDEEGPSDGGEAVIEWGGGGETGNDEWWKSWEELLRMRSGVLGWYRHQDLTAISGNVVRLWDDDRGRSCWCE